MKLNNYMHNSFKIGYSATKHPLSYTFEWYLQIAVPWQVGIQPGNYSQIEMQISNICAYKQINNEFLRCAANLLPSFLILLTSFSAMPVLVTV